MALCFCSAKGVRVIAAVAACTALLLFSFPTLAQKLDAIESEMVGKIVSYIDDEMTNSEIKGLALSIVHDDRIVHVQGFGVADDSGREVTPQTPFILGSLTKSFTAMAVLQLAERGLIDLEQPVKKYIPWFRVADEQASNEITIQHLLYQTSGFSSYDGRTRFTDSNDSAQALEIGIRELESINLESAVGEKFIYSNLNYDVLGLVIQYVTGVSYEEYVEQNIFEPLQMTSSFTNMESATSNSLAVGYNYFMGRPFATPDAPFTRKLISSGFLISSAEDLGNYMIVQLNGGKFMGNQLLSDASIELNHLPHKDSYAMGWFSQELNGKRFVSHDGMVSNYKSNIGLIPSEGWGIALLFNGQDMMFDGTNSILPVNVMRILAGMEPVASSVAITELAFYLVVVILVLQIINVPRTIRLAKAWRHSPPRPSWWDNSKYILLPFIFSVVFAIGIFTIVPLLDPIPWSGVLLFAPDAWVFLIAGIFSLVWGASRTVLLTTVLLKNR